MTQAIALHTEPLPPTNDLSVTDTSNQDRQLTTKLTCPAGAGSYDSRKAYMPTGSGAAPGSAVGKPTHEPGFLSVQLLGTRNADIRRDVSVAPLDFFDDPLAFLPDECRERVTRITDLCEEGECGGVLGQEHRG